MRRHQSTASGLRAATSPCRALLLLTTLLLFLPIRGESKEWKGKGIAFLYPNGWECHDEGLQTICQSSDTESKREAVIVVAAKFKGPQDQIDAYLLHLKTPKHAKDERGQLVPSTVKLAKTTPIKGHPWADALHLGSELPKFFTRYLATTTARLAVAVTFTVHESRYRKYVQDVYRLVDSLKVLSEDESKFVSIGEGDGDAAEMLDLPPMEEELAFQEDSGGGGASDMQKKIAALLIVLAVGAWVYMKRRQRR